ncbi:sugar ABC transporter permease [Amnibacterium sp. CER49]|uniref:carbohydrate ABC transporter permease n=1 Tax=Amnibacterium sp. CER49 TaxID=3039161 RepID=UPI00244C9B84|nr:sugar ABC transporter permease [Amnibacterium sp. CER49]MDH2442567.1 sugar ABC transporter permease [Amnibacterium sp. CER49]
MTDSERMQLSRREGVRSRWSLRAREVTSAYVLVTPALIIIALLIFFPAVQSTIDSFRQGDLTNPTAHNFIGLRNYLNALLDPSFLQAVRNTGVYIVVAVVVALLLGLLMAMWMQSLGGRARVIALTLIILPWAVPGTVAGNLWSFILNPTGSGLLNGVLESLGVIDQPQIWIASPLWGQVFIALSFCWGLVPLGAIIFLAGLESIPEDFYAQSYVDGATALQRFTSITLPLLRPALAIVLVNAAVSAIGIYDQVYVLAGFDPNKISLIGQTYLYAFRDFNFGLGYAASILTTVATTLIAAVFLKVVYREEQM